ncbi:hypothetical protein H0H81_008748, partial [Sphagnurus paluster]
IFDTLPLEDDSDSDTPVPHAHHHIPSDPPSPLAEPVSELDNGVNTGQFECRIFNEYRQPTVEDVDDEEDLPILEDNLDEEDEEDEDNEELPDWDALEKILLAASDAYGEEYERYTAEIGTSTILSSLNIVNNVVIQLRNFPPMIALYAARLPTRLRLIPLIKTLQNYPMSFHKSLPFQS